MLFERACPIEVGDQWVEAQVSGRQYSAGGGKRAKMTSVAIVQDDREPKPRAEKQRQE